MHQATTPSIAFTANDFTPTPSCSAEAKALIANRLVTFIASGCQRRLFTRGTYRTLVESFGFEPCGRQRCYQRHFWNAERRLAALGQIADHVPTDDATYSTSDVQWAIIGWVRQRVLPKHDRRNRG